MGQGGSVMVMVLALTILLISLAGGFLYATGVFIGNSGWEETDAQVLWLAEAGMQKAVWNLKTPAGSGGQGESWTTVGTTQNLGGGTYTMVVERWDFALASNGATASDNPAQTNSSIGPAKAIDGDNSTYWESHGQPGEEEDDNDGPQDLIITFPYTLTLNKVHFVSPSSGARPTDYSWDVSSDGVTYTTVLTVSNNGATDVTDTFSVAANPAAASVKYLRLRTTRDGPGNPQRVRISLLEAIGSRVTSTGTVTVSGNNYTRSVRQAFVTDDASPQNQVAYKEPDWLEL